MIFESARIRTDGKADVRETSSYFIRVSADVDVASRNEFLGWTYTS
jgi:hypothetical protein